MEKYFENRKNFVSDFVSSYLIGKQLEEVSGFDENADFTTTVKTVDMNPFDTKLAEGQIRLLSQTQRVTYVALLRRWGDDAFVVMPFSRFDSPATDEELKTSFDGGMYLRVLQAWNTRSLQDESLEKSWLIGCLPQNDIEDALALWESTLEDKELDDAIVQRTGLPIYRSNDPRLQYKREELANFARLDAEDIKLAEKPKFMLWTKQSENYSLLGGRLACFAPAALVAGGKKPNLQFIFTAESPYVVVFIEYSQHDKVLSFAVYDSHGVVSNDLDSCMVIDNSDGTVLGTIEDGTLEVPYDSTECSVSFIDADGQEISGTFKQENDKA